MPSFNDELQDALDNEFYTDTYAYKAKYNGADIMLIDDGQFDRLEHFPGFQTASMTAWVRQSEVQSPEVGDKIELGGLIWRVGSGPVLNAGEWRLTLHRDDGSVIV